MRTQRSFCSTGLCGSAHWRGWSGWSGWRGCGAPPRTQAAMCERTEQSMWLGKPAATHTSGTFPFDKQVPNVKANISPISPFSYKMQRVLLAGINSKGKSCVFALTCMDLAIVKLLYTHTHTNKQKTNQHIRTLGHVYLHEVYSIACASARVLFHSTTHVYGNSLFNFSLQRS